MSVRRALALVLCCAPATLFAAPAANAATDPFCALHDAAAGQTVALSSEISVTPGTLTASGSCASGSVSFSNATIHVGPALTATGAAGTATPTGLKLTAGSFTTPQTVSTQSFVSSPDAPVTLSFGGGGTVALSGKLVPQTSGGSTLRTASLRAAAVTTSAAATTDPSPETAAPKPPGGGTWTWSVDLDAEGLALHGVSTYARVDGVVRWDSSYSFTVALVDYPFNGDKLSVSGGLSGSDIFHPAQAAIDGAISNLRLSETTVISGKLHWDADGGLSLGGTLQQDCLAGGLTASAQGAITDGTHWSLLLDGSVLPAGCQMASGLTLPKGTVHGSFGADGGRATGELAMAGSIQSSLLPAGASSWSMTGKLTIAPDKANNHIAFSADSAVGGVSGDIGADGTFNFAAHVTADLAKGATIAGSGSISRLTPKGPVVTSIAGSISNLALGNNATLTRAELRWKPGALELGAAVQVNCPVSGTMTASVRGAIPATPTAKDWTLKADATAGSNGCGLTKELALGAGSGGSITLLSSGGSMAIDLDGSAHIATTLVPTKSGFDVSAHIHAGAGGFKVSVSGATTGASFSGAIAGDGTFSLAFSIDDLKIKDVSLGAHGSVARTTPGGSLTYDLGGSLAGQVKLTDSVYLTSGSLSFSNNGLALSGSVRLMCTSGYLDATAGGSISDSKNWSLKATGNASSCKLGRAATFNGNTFSASITAKDGVVSFDAGMSASKIELFSTQLPLAIYIHTWLTNVSGRITNTCSACNNNGLQLSFGGTGNADGSVLMFLPYQFGATVNGSVLIANGKIASTGLSISNVRMSIGAIGIAPMIQDQLDRDTRTGFTTA